ncbi:MAG TPA: RDD family protein [Bryobacteraceae bacterium]|nr:RDD family protein [Bryobacteraceae bacterium]
MEWFYAKDGKQLGPVTAEDLAQLLRTGVMTPDSLVWHAGMAEWQAYRTAAGMPPPIPPGGMAVAGQAVPGAVEYGGFWIRFVAYVIDGSLIGMIRAILVFPMGIRLAEHPFSWWSIADIGEIQLTSLAVSLCYFVFFWSRYGATPGKMIFRLRVVTPTGGPITLSQAVGRYFAMLLSGIILGIGFLMAAWDPEARTLHDRLAETRVIREPEGTRRY